MSINATVEKDMIKLPAGLHLPDGTPVRIETMPLPAAIREDDPIYRLHEFAAPAGGSLTDREMDALVYGV